VLRARHQLLLTAALLGITGLALAAKPVRVNGSTTINPIVTEAAEALRAQRGMTIHVDTQGGSSGGIAALGDGRAEVAMISRPIEDEDRTRFPKIRFQGTRIGSDAVALVVSRDVWEGGVKALSRAQVKGIYEGKIRSWREVGGSDKRIVFFNKEPGRGTWEVFAHWLYGNPKTAPLVNFPEVGANEEARNKVASTPGAISQLSSAWADGRRVFALGIRRDDGKTALPTLAAVRDGSYPLARPLLVVTDGPPSGEVKILIDFLLSPRGQALVEKHGYLANTPAKAKKGAAR
jgi:phosphate transport system substrate-binding protein